MHYVKQVSLIWQMIWILREKDWSELEKTYHANPTISKLVGAEREIPFSTKPLRKESAYTERLKQENPKLERKLKNSRRLRRLALYWVQVLE